MLANETMNRNKTYFSSGLEFPAWKKDLLVSNEGLSLGRGFVFWERVCLLGEGLSFGRRFGTLHVYLNILIVARKAMLVHTYFDCVTEPFARESRLFTEFRPHQWIM
jgi:hypothetical protein